MKAKTAHRPTRESRAKRQAERHAAKRPERTQRTTSEEPTATRRADRKSEAPGSSGNSSRQARNARQERRQQRRENVAVQTATTDPDLAKLTREIGAELGVYENDPSIGLGVESLNDALYELRSELDNPNYAFIGVKGEAGTGKTFEIVRTALDQLRRGEIKRIVLLRPSVTAAGEDLGFLPGSRFAKIIPFMKPFLRQAVKLIGLREVARLINEHRIIIEILAYMRGDTLEDAFVIVDEAQNTTVEQIKMITTRIGQGSKLVIAGDRKQGDLAVATTGLQAFFNAFKDRELSHLFTMPNGSSVRSRATVVANEAWHEYDDSNK